MLTTHEVKQGTPEWHGLRLQYPHTASLAPVLLAKGKNAASNTQGARSGGFWADRGHILEDEAIEVYEAVYGAHVARPGFITNDEFPDCGYSPDGLDEHAGYPLPLEVKCFKEEKHLLCLDDTPKDPYVQLQFGIMIMAVPAGRLIFYNPDVEDSNLCFKVIEVPRDEPLIARFKERLYGKK